VSTATYPDVYKKKKRKKKRKKKKRKKKEVDCFAISESTMARRKRGYRERTAGDDNSSWRIWRKGEELQIGR
jgi:hypothetical protein